MEVSPGCPAKVGRTRSLRSTTIRLRLRPHESVVSAVTLAELSVGPHVARTAKERAARQVHLQQAESDFDTIAFDAGAARAFGRVAASLRSAGRKPAARAYDAWIAASAMAEDLPLYTRNPDDFAGIDGLDVRPASRSPGAAEAIAADRSLPVTVNTRSATIRAVRSSQRTRAGVPRRPAEGTHDPTHACRRGSRKPGAGCRRGGV